MELMVDPPANNAAVVPICLKNFLLAGVDMTIVFFVLDMSLKIEHWKSTSKKKHPRMDAF
jgi:hypothetical protein